MNWLTVNKKCRFINTSSPLKCGNCDNNCSISLFAVKINNYINNEYKDMDIEGIKKEAEALGLQLSTITFKKNSDINTLPTMSIVFSHFSEKNLTFDENEFIISKKIRNLLIDFKLQDRIKELDIDENLFFSKIVDDFNNDICKHKNVNKIKCNKLSAEEAKKTKWTDGFIIFTNGRISFHEHFEWMLLNYF